MTLWIKCDCGKQLAIASGAIAHVMTLEQIQANATKAGWLTEQQGEETIYTCPHCNETNERK